LKEEREGERGEGEKTEEGERRGRKI
jgi:hypothetical protein